MIVFKTALVSLLLMGSLLAKSQKLMSEGSLTYNIAVETGNKEPKMADFFDGATTTIYIKGSQSRSELLSSLGTEVNLHDSKTGTGIILKDYSGQKLMITLTKDDWDKKNKKYEGISFQTTAETKEISGYSCKKAIATLKDGTVFTVYYTPELTVANKDYDYQFKTLPGLALQYEWESGKLKFQYTIAKISFEPVPASKFDYPKTGYRVLTFEEAQKLR